MTRTTDHKKRTTLKTLSTAVAVTMTPSLASAVCGTSSTLSEAGLPDEGLHLSFMQATNAKRQTVSLENNSNEAITLKHVSPGLVKSEGTMFDVNSLLADGPVTLQAGESRLMVLSPVASDASETRVPAGVIHPHAVTVSSRYHAYPIKNELRTARTRRMLLS